jgi:hypothetical protein
MLTTEVARRLELHLGLGGFPMVRRRLYARLQRLCVQLGDQALKIVAAVAEEAMGPKIRDKGRYFSWVIKRRLQENGIDFGERDEDGTCKTGRPPGQGPYSDVQQATQKVADASRIPPEGGW